MGVRIRYPCPNTETLCYNTDILYTVLGKVPFFNAICSRSRTVLLMLSVPVTIPVLFILPVTDPFICNDPVSVFYYS